ncbi:MAG: urea ABC transporter permease subunit UrtB [Pedosphaera sp.]|nr:urea ABC transporter permease subunit UrtB [Pedosphaera sp.]
MIFLRWTLLAAALFGWIGGEAAESPHRANLVEALLTEDESRQIEIIRGLAESGDSLVQQALAAWRQGGVYINETNEIRTPFLTESQTDSTGWVHAIRIADGELLKDGAGAAFSFLSSELTALDTSSKLRRAIKTTLDLFALADPNPKMRRDAAVKLGQEQNAEYLSYLEGRMKTESDPEATQALSEAVATTQLSSDDSRKRLEAIEHLRRVRSVNAFTFLEALHKMAKENPARYGKETLTATSDAISEIQSHMRTATFYGTGFRGLSLAAVLLVAALGLAITFGLMGIINMAHGEVMMIGAYTAYVTQNAFKGWFGASGPGFDAFFLVALFASFVTAGAVGLALERGIIRFLYRRPLESLLATWGVSLVLQQLIRQMFGAANVQVGAPSWLSGSLVIHDVLLAFNRMFVIGFAAFILLLTYLLLTRTSLGLQIRAVMQNRQMAAALGVRTDWVNMMTFAFGSGLAGMAGACLSQIANVGPSLGQNYIFDCFMVVVLGGVGSLVGTLYAALGIGVTDQILQPWLGAVMGKITVLAAIILFLQWRPSGLFASRSRSLDG